MSAAAPEEESGPGLVTRPAGAADVTALVEMVQNAYRGQGGPGRWTTEAHLVRGRRTSPGEVLEAIEAGRSTVLVAEDDQGLLASCHVRDLGAGRAYLGMFAVRPGQQGRGVGRAMMAAAEAWATGAWGCRRVEMHVIAGRDELLAWYERLGYHPTGQTIAFPYDRDDDVPRRPGLHFVILERTLTP
ncbi:MAG TPA: GNAT family N-acetyltransferase [Acidimicrobiales bacterium]|nr:GNAT family N-acetyltransferase [Acidimicrobiales bacterium]